MDSPSALLPPRCPNDLIAQNAWNLLSYARRNIAQPRRGVYQEAPLPMPATPALVGWSAVVRSS